MVSWSSRDQPTRVISETLLKETFSTKCGNKSWFQTRMDLSSKAIWKVSIPRHAITVQFSERYAAFNVFSGVNRLQAGVRSMYFGPDMSVRAVIENQRSNCNITELPRSYRTIYYSMGFQKNWEFRKLFDYYIGR